jgi:hypothetical protein
MTTRYMDMAEVVTRFGLHPEVGEGQGRRLAYEHEKKIVLKFTCHSPFGPRGDLRTGGHHFTEIAILVGFDDEGFLVLRRYDKDTGELREMSKAQRLGPGIKFKSVYYPRLPAADKPLLRVVK